ncbi:MAG TPA: hypothetical protein VFE24_05805 [Pirellulales bacterium]|nr:hypothetical protein [Pirellulales bacterium]
MRCAVFSVGGILFAVLAFGALVGSRRSVSSAADEPKNAPTSASLKAEIEQLKKLLPDQASAMLDAAQQAAQLYHAGAHENWPLTQFYWGETRSHLRWAVALKPLRQDSQKHEIKLADILEALENGPLKQVQTAITAKDKSQFIAAYRTLLEGCYACHKTVEKPYLKLQLPPLPSLPIINCDPQADWPK